MATIGLNNFRYGKLLTETGEGTQPTYGTAKIPGKAISCSVDISSNDATLYADDALVESDYSFQSGKVTIGIDEDDIQTMGHLLGHTVTSTGTSPNITYTITRNSNDTAPYVGLGRVITKMVNGVRQYKVEFLYKVKFSEPKAENNTRGESTEFGTCELEGTVSTLSDGRWSVAQVFPTKEAALTYLTGMFGSDPT